MNFCQPHWDRLRERIFAAGLESLIADDGSEAAQKMADQLTTEETTLSNYDPLMTAMFAVTNYCYGAMGDDNARRVLTEGACPVCIAQHVHDISKPSNPHEETAACNVEEFAYSHAVDDEVERSKKLLRGETDV